MLPEKLKQPSTELMSAFASAWPVILLAITGIHYHQTARLVLVVACCMMNAQQFKLIRGL
jgi:hypothetical protein